jgi:hypothetical protein
MKTKFFSIVCLNIIALIINFPNPASCQYDSVFRFTRTYDDSDDTTIMEMPESEDELTVETFYWGENNEGLTPKETIYIESFNRIYVYGSRGIVVINPVSKAVECSIPLSDYGQYHKLTGLLTAGGNRMAFDNDHRIYCLTDEFHLKVIDLQTNAEVDDVDLSANFTNNNDQITKTVLRYDSNRNMLFVFVSLATTTGYLSKCFRFHITNYIYLALIRNIEYTNIYDVEIHGNSDYIFITYLQKVFDVMTYYFSVFDFDFLPVTEISAFESSTGIHEIEYIYEPLNDIHKAIGFPASGFENNHVAFVFNGDSFAQSTINLLVNQSHVTSTEYVASEHVIYYSYDPPANDGIGKLSIINYQIEDIIVPTSSYTSDILVSASKIFMGKKDKIFVVDKNPPHNCLIHDYFDDVILSFSASSNNVFSIDYENCSLEIFDNSGNFDSRILLGGVCLSGTFNSLNNKTFMYNRSISDYFQRLYIMNLNTHENDFIDFTEFGFGYISGVISDELRGLIYVSIASDPFNSDAEIIIIDAETNTIHQDSYLLPNNTVCRNMYLYDDKLFCILEHYYAGSIFQSKVYIIDLANPGMTFLLTTSQNLLQGQLYASLESTESGNVIISLNEFGDINNGMVIGIDNNNSIYFSYPVIDPYKISYDEMNERIFCSRYFSSSILGIIDLVSQQVSYLDLSNYFLYLIETVYDKFRNEVCIIGHYNDPDPFDIRDTRFAWLSPSSYEVTNLITTDPMAISFAYNPQSGDIYSFYPNVNSANNMQCLGKIPRISCVHYLYPLTNGHRPLIFNYSWPPNVLFLTQDFSYLFVPNHYFSDLYKIACPPDQVTIYPETFNWISFPRLEREGNDPVLSQPLLEQITPFPTYLRLLHRDPEYQYFLDKTYQEHSWSGELENVRSTLGYKLETNNQGPSVLPLSGTILPSETTLPLYGFKSNWTGYFPTWTQSPFDAIGTEFLDKITWMAGQKWFCHKESQPQQKNSGYWWRCACEQGRIEIRYGEMVVIYPSEDIGDFHWQYGGSPPGEEPKGASLSFSYTEKAEYDAIFIELDTLNMPSEIGAFAGDSCIGATTVFPYDTMVLICAYTQGFEGEEITFEQLYPTKSYGQIFKDYFVLNTRTGIRERRQITAGESQPYFVVSLEQNPMSPRQPGASWLVCSPNPAQNEVTVSYSLDVEANVSLQLVNALGKVVITWQPGMKSPGSYDLKFSSMDLPAGIYQLRMITGSSQAIRKVIIVH